MESQGHIQIPFELSNNSSNSPIVIPNSVQKAEMSKSLPIFRKYKTWLKDEIAFLKNNYRQNYCDVRYTNGKKVVTREILDKLELLGIAVWYCDDGNYNYLKKNIIISTDCFTFEENNIIIEWFRNKYDIDWKIYSEKKWRKLYYFISINNKYNTQKFIELIKPYVPECMNYKLGFVEKKLV